MKRVLLLNAFVGLEQVKGDGDPSCLRTSVNFVGRKTSLEVSLRKRRGRRPDLLVFVAITAELDVANEQNDVSTPKARCKLPA